MASDKEDHAKYTYRCLRIFFSNMEGALFSKSTHWPAVMASFATLDSQARIPAIDM
ncbi:hypothetical protein CLOSCI_03476 [[Clostridium] scindens ATCC 35704]|jgi:hypothetical protein|nr:hypothetical protein CLOSCI_03476 [[Clostridium] scindens ATCC 35704]